MNLYNWLNSRLYKSAIFKINSADEGCYHRLLFTFHFSLFIRTAIRGQSPSTKWRQVNTDTVRVIFPKGWDVQAQRIATIVHQLQKQYAHSIGDSIRKINVVLQDQTLFSNAYVGLAPYEVNFILPHPDAFTLGA